MNAWKDPYAGLLSWLETVPGLLGWLVGFSVFAFVGSLIVLPIVIARMDADYFVRPRKSARRDRTRHPLLRALLVGTKNFLGVMFIVAGVFMLVLPGQGLLSILVGASLTDFPGKRRVELALVRRQRILSAINWIRRKANAPPLNVP